MDGRYLLFCPEGTDFYDRPHRRDGGFALASARAPRGWRRGSQGPWVSFSAPRPLPDQGWKVHVSTSEEHAEKTLHEVSSYCFTNGISFKFLRGPHELRAQNSKYADRGSSGKFCTLYTRNETELKNILTELGESLSGIPGPYVLSDLRWKSGPLYVRYGGFRERYCVTADGRRVHAIETPEGELVPDPREPGFRPPSWVPMPAFLAEAAQDEDDAEDFPFTPETALHFSNAGGVYRARDRRDGRTVVLKEARPWAGVDVLGDDAVTRLEREAAVLERLSGLDCVPEYHGLFTAWEHKFVVLEHVEGLVLKRAAMNRTPVLVPGFSAERDQEYVRWALDTLAQIEEAVRRIHARGVVIGDLHPKNIILREDGSPVFVDFEFSALDDPQWRAPQGAPGFVAPPGLRGTAADRWVLACLKLDMFLPVTPMLLRAPGKVEQLVRAAERRFRLPRDFAAGLLADLSPEAAAPSRHGPPLPLSPVAASYLSGRPVEDAALKAEIAQGIRLSATPERHDRLYPGDIEQFLTCDGLGLAFGAAGVLLALAESGLPRPVEHEEWLVRRTAEADEVHPGFYTGLHGIAYALDRLGRRSDALDVLERAGLRSPATEQEGFGLFRGLAGEGLNLLHFAEETGDREFHEAALRVADRLATAMAQQPDTAAEKVRAGLVHGWSGACLFFLRLHRRTGDSAALDLALRALTRDLDRCTVTKNDSLEVSDDWRTLPYLEFGSTGVGIALDQYLASTGTEDPKLLEARSGIDRAASYEFYYLPGVFNGRAGILLYLAQALSLRPDEHLRRTARRLVEGLPLYAGTHAGHLAFAGNHLLRFSADLASGAAGILLALNAYGGGRSLPFLAYGPPEAAGRTS
ncbi:class III lanthionine synthetase LanKC [Thermobifida cellulosilytica]|uniref:Protein kinase domain-containing protein n=1 Tax=Thermobifida cellulosilytica TB100 TaxID=665004 RepID=A0A147KKD9_THECS|nr:class III lanthionine synthetase LanKC [Thermobifida cellulosilytica]KUP97738.1 hypothetical protein AC529_04530 [Thermobifida cellulosilytica TB100]